MKKMILIAVIINFFCEPRFDSVILKKNLIGSECDTTSRKYIFTEKSFCCSESVVEGEMVVGTSSDYIVYKGRKYSSIKKEYMTIMAESLGSMPEWQRLEIICPINGKIIFDSGVVKTNQETCYNKKIERYYFAFDGTEQSKRILGCTD